MFILIILFWFLYFSTVTSAVFTDQDVVVSGSDDRTVKVRIMKIPGG